jgi:YHS domain-containing protein
MKAFAGIAAALAAVGLAWAATQAANTTCPVKKGEAVKAGITASYKGKTVAFCCNNCKKEFEANPEKYVAGIPELAGPQPPASLPSVEDALKAGKEKPVIILFLDYGAKSDVFEKKTLTDPILTDLIAKVAYVTVKFKKDDDNAKKWKVTAAPTLLIVDAQKEDDPKELKRVTGGTAAALKKELEAALKKYEKK